MADERWRGSTPSGHALDESDGGLVCVQGLESSCKELQCAGERIEGFSRSVEATLGKEENNVCRQEGCWVRAGRIHDASILWCRLEFVDGGWGSCLFWQTLGRVVA